MTVSTYYLDARGRTTIDKDAGATLDYQFDWTDFLTGISDTIASATASGFGVTVGAVSFAGAVVTVWVSGGLTSAPHASVTCTITTASTPPRIEPMTIQLRITPKVT